MQTQYYQRHHELWASLAQAADSGVMPELIATDAGDRRFQAPEWKETPFFSYLRQAYVLNSRWLSEMADGSQLDAQSRRKLLFYTRQLIDAASPANLAWTNPEAIKRATETSGASAAKGMQLLGTDIKKGRITTNDENAFEVARNVAITPGAVVFENELIQLIQYRPATAEVYARPLLMVPPCINKYYILDLQPHNSLVRYAVSQGHTVFMVSWRNATPEMGGFTWDRYLESGVIAAIDAALAICNVDKLNVLGFCVGGTLLCSALAVLKARHRIPAASLTLLAAMLDFSDTGDISVFVDESYVRQREVEFAAGGLMSGRQLAATFSSLRPNELIWNYVIKSYLKGDPPPAFDLLYWNSDGTNLPGAMFVYYIRNMYLENSLRVPRKLAMCGQLVDLSIIDAPAYVLASREDHIVPWKTAFQSTCLLGGRSQFVLAASGHIAGVINPASANKRHYWSNGKSAPDPELWMEGATRQSGSWWPHWIKWLSRRGGGKISAPGDAGSPGFPVVEPAPGRYVLAQCD